jgi:hypothetical protein
MRLARNWPDNVKTRCTVAPSLRSATTCEGGSTMIAPGATGGSTSNPTQCVRSRWLNTLVVGVMLLFMIAALANTVIPSENVTSRQWRPALIVLAIAISFGLFGGMSIRAARIGVCRHAHGIRVRGLFHTRLIRCESIVSTGVRRSSNGRGGISYTPVLMTSTPSGERLVNLWWLASVRISTAKQRADQVNAMVRQVCNASALD